MGQRNYGEEALAGRRNYGEEDLAGRRNYGKEALAGRRNYGEEALAGQRNYGEEALAGRRNYGEEALARGLVYLSLMRYLDALPHLCIIRHVKKHWHPVYYMRENLYPQKLSIEAVSPKMRRFNKAKIRTFTVVHLLGKVSEKNCISSRDGPAKSTEIRKE